MVAGDVMGARTKRSGAVPEPDKVAIDAAYERAFAPLGRKSSDKLGDLPALR